MDAGNGTFGAPEPRSPCADKNVALPLEDLYPVDVWQKEIYIWYENTHDIDRIRDSDETFVYQLRPLAEVQAIAADI
jgi:hypothetical protein